MRSTGAHTLHAHSPPSHAATRHARTTGRKAQAHRGPLAGAASRQGRPALQRLPESDELAHRLAGGVLRLAVAGEEVVEAERKRHGQMEAHARDEEEQEQETPQREGRGVRKRGSERGRVERSAEDKGGWGKKHIKGLL